MSLHHPSPNSLDHDFVFERDKQEALQDELRQKLRSRGGGGLGPNPASGGGGGGGSSSPASGGGNSQSNGGGGNASNTDEEPQEAQQPVEEEQEEVQEQVVSLTNAKFIIPESEEELDKKVGIDKEIELEVDVEYLGERKPSSIQFKVSLEHDGVVEDLPIVNGSVSGGKATAKVTLLMHNGFYGKVNKPDGEKYVAKLNTLCDADGTECVGTNEVELPRKQKQIFMVEIHSDVFPHDNIIPCLDTNATLIDSLATAFRHVGHYDDVEKGVKGADHELVVHGHASTLSDSEVRAKAIKTLVEDRRSNWSTLCTSYGTIKDYQQSLKVLSDSYGWDCDPGSVDGDDGAKTIAAIMGFQRTYNSSNGGQQDLLIDGEWGPKCWKGLFNTIRSLALYLSQVDKSRIKTRFHSKVDGVLPCASAFPKSDTGCPEYKSSTDERVELLYFPKPNPPVLATPASDAVTTQEAGAYDQALCDIEVVPFEQSKDGIESLSDIIFYCNHQYEEEHLGKKIKFNRIARGGEVLNIVPPEVGEAVTLNAQRLTNVPQTDWNLKGFTASTSLENKFETRISNWKHPIEHIIPRNRRIEHGVRPKVVEVKAIGVKGKEVTGEVHVWPNDETSIEWDLSKKFEFFKTLSDEVTSVCSFIPMAELKFEYFVGKIQASGCFKEDPTSNEAFYALKVNGGFKPFIGATLSISISIWELIGLPRRLMRYGLDILAGVDLIGKIELTLSMERSELTKATATGGIEGSIGFSLWAKAQAGSDKLLEVKCSAGTAIVGSGTMPLSYDWEKNDWDLALNTKIGWAGAAAEVSWAVWDGKWTGGGKKTLIEGCTWAEGNYKLF
ncbi:MAG: peptidoglycan-binding protein [Fibrobacterales bacterium]